MEGYEDNVGSQNGLKNPLLSKRVMRPFTMNFKDGGVRSARTRTLDASIVATSRGPYDPDGPRAPDGSITHAFRKQFSSRFLLYVLYNLGILFPH